MSSHDVIVAGFKILFIPRSIFDLHILYLLCYGVLNPYFMSRFIFDPHTTIYYVNLNKIQDIFTVSRKVLIVEKTKRRGVMTLKEYFCR